MEYKRLSLSFCLDDAFAPVRCTRDGRTALEMECDNDAINCRIFYDFSVEPLVLQGKVKVGDSIQVRLMQHRIELLVNDTVADEEWPAGECLFHAGRDLPPFIHVNEEMCGGEDTALPGVIKSFENAEGWRPDDHVFVGDCMPYTAKGRYHVLYLKDRRHHCSKWGLGAHQWGHISTADFVHWDIHPMAVPITRPWEGSICTGSWIAHENKEYLYYTIRMADRSSAPICRSVSGDGYHFEKDEGYRFHLPVRYDGVSARDPKMICGVDGLFHMILTTSLAEEKKGCLAHLVSTDLETWQDEGPIYISDDETQPECPDYIVYKGKYYLIFSLHATAQYRYSTEPFTGWKVPRNPEIPCASVPKGAVWQDQIIFTGYQSGDKRKYADVMTFRSAVAGENGELVFV